MVEAGAPDEPGLARADGGPAGKADRVVIAMLTYRRPLALLRALRAVAEQAIECGASVLVIDNDPDASAMRQAASIGPIGEVRFVHEPTPGIGAARNRALAECDHANVLVFIDDDELPGPGWLDALLTSWRATGASAVSGPVEPLFDGPLDPWIAAGGFFDDRSLPDGAVIDVAATNNLLLDLTNVRGLDLTFDSSFRNAGASDTLFTRELHRRGGRMIWSTNATVFEHVPQDRMTRRWVVQRSFRSGNSWSRSYLDLEMHALARTSRRAALVSQGLIRIAGGLAKRLLGECTRSLGHQATGTRIFCRGLGMLTGAVGYVYNEYKR